MCGSRQSTAYSVLYCTVCTVLYALMLRRLSNTLSWITSLGCPHVQHTRSAVFAGVVLINVRFHIHDCEASSLARLCTCVFIICSMFLTSSASAPTVDAAAMPATILAALPRAQPYSCWPPCDLKLQKWAARSPRCHLLTAFFIHPLRLPSSTSPLVDGLFSDR